MNGWPALTTSARALMKLRFTKYGTWAITLPRLHELHDVPAAQTVRVR